MHVLVVGAGAVGSFLGWAVAAGGGRTTLVRRGFAGEPGATVPLHVTHPDGADAAVEVGVVPSVEAAAAGDAPDLVIVAVRQYDLADALAALATLPDVPVLTAQNGVGAEEAATEARPGAPLLAASVTASVEREPGGDVKALRRGGVGLAAVRGEGADELVGRLAATLRDAGVEVVVHDNAAAMKWSKLVGNLVGNATSGILDMDPSSIYADSSLFEVERDQLREGLAVMRARGLKPVSLPGTPIPLLAFAVTLPSALARTALGLVVGSARGGKDPSLRGAVQAGPPTEAGWLNGSVSRAGASLGVPTPVNDALARLADEAAADPERRAWFRQRPDRLLEALGRS
jgi:2-dehydropantoate 2-reductase